MKCLQVQEAEIINPANWKLNYEGIESFNFKEGKLVQLRIKEEITTNPPADGSSIKWILLKVLKEKIIKTPSIDSTPTFSR